MKSIVITGATSMIGVALIEEALKDLNLVRIYAVVRPQSYNLARIPKDKRIRIIECDVSEYDRLFYLINERCDVFFHLAWPRTSTYEESYEDVLIKCDNVKNTLIAVKAAHELGCNKFIGAGSQSEYGLVDAGKISPDTPCNPIRAEGFTRYTAGMLAALQAKEMGMDFAWMRIFSIYGKYDRANSMINSTIVQLMNGRHCSFTPCEQKWDFLYAEDAGRAFYMTGKNLKGSHVYCVGSGYSKPLREFIIDLRDIVAPGVELGIGDLEYPRNPVMNLCADITNLQNDVGWRPNTDFKDGILKLYHELKNME